MNKRAFTLIEMISVLVIIGIMTALTLPAFNMMRKGAEIKSSARTVTSALRYARRLAITRNAVYQVEFEQNAGVFTGRFFVEDSTGGGVENQASDFLELDGNVFFDAVTNPASGNNLLAGGNVVAFSSNGSCSTGTGAIIIKNQDNRFFNVHVTNTTGRVRINAGTETPN